MKDEWADFTQALTQAAEDVVFGDPKIDSPLLEAQGLRYLSRVAALGSKLETSPAADPRYPMWIKYQSPWLDWGIPNPDALYLQAPLNGDYTYRVSGRSGTAHIHHFQVFEGVLYDLRTVRSFCAQDEFKAGANGEIEIVLSREEQPGNWLPLPDGPCWLSFWQVFADWDNEHPAELTVERVGASYPPPAESAADVSDQVRRMTRLVGELPGQYRQVAETFLASDPTVVPFPPVDWGFDRDTKASLADQHYGRGHYRCEPDEAVILEVEPPDAHYWSFALGTVYWQTPDMWCRAMSINHHQAVLDADGTFRAVIAQQDPGVPNWLDAGTHATGCIFGRYYRSSTGAPVPTLRTVPLADVRSHLPQETPVITPDARSESLRRRMLCVQRRNYDV